MFTGLVQDIGIVSSVESNDDGCSLTIETQMNLSSVQIGASIMCSGCCLTVVEKTKNTFRTDVSNETLTKTNVGACRVMDRINLEPSLKAGDELGGHIVSGHVDITACILSITPDGDSYRIQIEIPDGYAPYIAPKGSITIDGISLTVNEVTNDVFGVNIIPHTWTHTTLQYRKIDDLVNIEIDILARYVANMLRIKDGS